MATWRVSFTDPADRYIAEQLDGKDASYWQDSLRTRAKPSPGTPGGLQALVEHLAPEYGIDPAFASAIAQTESNYQPGVVSSAGAKGVMQLMDGCVTTDTEALTKRGWLFVDEIVASDELLTYSLEKGVCEWQHMIRLPVRYIASSLIQLTGRSFDFVVTPDHKWVAYAGYPGKKFHQEVLRETTSLMTKSPWYIRRVAQYDWPVKSSVDDSFVALLGWVFAEGTIDPRANRRGVSIYQKCEHHVATIDRLLGHLCGCGIYRENDRKCGTIRWILPPFLAEAVIDIMGRDKRLPLNFLTKITYAQALVLYEAILDGDGWRSTVAAHGTSQAHMQEGFCQSDKGRMDDFQALAFLLGRVTNVASYDGRQSFIRGKAYQQKERFQCHVSLRQTAYVPRLAFVPIGAGEVWCPTVPNGTWVARRRGRVTITGNTAKRFGVRDSFDPEQNIRGGLAYLQVLQELFPGRRDLQMAAYNAGEGAVKKYGNVIPPYPETQDYVRKVTARLARTTPQSPQEHARLAALQQLREGQPANTAATATPLPMASEFLTAPSGLPVPDMDTSAPAQAPDGGTAQPDVWMPAPKPIEKAYRGGLLGGINALGASIGIGLTGAAASVLEAPTTALRMAGVVEEEGQSPLEQAADYLRTTIIPRAQEAQQGMPPLLQQIGEGIGAGLTLLAPGLGLARGVASVAANAPKIAAMLGATTSGVLQGTVAMNDTYRALTPLVGEAEAGKRAQTALMTNTVLGSVGNALGLFNPWLPGALSRVVAGAASQGVQGGIQYDWNRRLFWVPADAEKAEALTQMGWEQQGDRVVQPYRFKDQLEAALVNAVVGGVFGAAAELGRLPVPAGLKEVADDPGFSVDRALQAAIAPDTPPVDVELPLWQRWAKAVLELLPEPSMGPSGAGALRGEEGRLSGAKLVAAHRGAGALAKGNTGIRTWTRAMSDQVQGFTPEDRRAIFAESQAILKKQIQAIGRNLPTTEELLKLYEGGKDSADWYAGAMEELRLHFGDDAEIVAGLIAATSPQTRVAQNIRLALQAYAQWKTGEEITLRGLETSAENARRVTRGEEMSGPKINNFYRNILGDPESVTVDVWMMRLMGLSRPGVKDVPSMVQYRMVEEWVSELAQEAGVSPRDMQAALWVGYKLLNPIIGEKQADVTKPLRDYISTEVASRRTRLAETNPELARILWGQGGSADAELLTHLAVTMAGGLAGCMQGDTTEDCIKNALIGAGIGGMASVSLLRYLRRNLRTFSQAARLPGEGSLLERAVAEEGADVPDEAGEVMPQGLFSRVLGGERGAISPERMHLRRQRVVVDEQLAALDRGGDDAQSVLESLGVTDADAAQDQLMAQRQGIVDELAALPPEPVEPVPLATPATQVAPQPTAPAEAAPTPAEMQAAYGLAQQALPRPWYRSESGRLLESLAKIPTTELELQDAIKQPVGGRWGIKLTGETDVPGELRALISPRETGVHGLLNNRNGFTLNEMAQRLKDADFIKSADKESLLVALDDSINQGNYVYSQSATGHAPLVDTPAVSAAYDSVRQLVQHFEARTEEQRRGTRPHAVAISEAATMIQAGGWTTQDVLDMFPGTVMDDTGIAQVVLTARDVTNQMIQAAQKVMETGGRDQNAIEDYLTIKSMFADIHVAVTGMAAESGRILSMWNDPMAPHKRYMDGLKDLMLQHGNDTALKMARADLSLATPEEAALAQRLKAEAQAQFEERTQRAPLLGPEQAPMRDDWAQQQTLFPADAIAETWATVMGEAMPTDVSPTAGVPPLPTDQGPGLPPKLATARSPEQVRRDADAQRVAMQDFVRKLREEAGLPSEAELFRRRHAAEPLSRMHDPAETDPPLFTPGELEPRLKRALDWDVLTPDERRAAQEALAHFAGYRRRARMTEPAEAAQPLMLGTDPFAPQAPTDVELAREAGLSTAQLRVMQANLGQAQPGKWDMYLEQWKAALLGPPTWIANAASNTAMGIYSLPVRFFAGVASNVRQGLDYAGQQMGLREVAPIEPGVSVWETGDLLYGMTHGWADHLRAMAHTWRTGESRIDTGRGKTDVHPKALTAENLGLEGTAVGKVMEFWAEHIGFMSFGRDTFRVLNTSDEAYLNVFYAMERQALAQSEARAQGLSGLSRAEAMAKVMSDPNVAEWIHTQAVDEAKYLTLRTSLPTEGIASLLGRMAHWRLGPEGMSIPAGQLTTPFYTVPTNAAIATVDNSPLALLSSKFYGDLAAGGRRADMAMGRLITGSLTTAAVAGLVGAMVITGRAPADPVQKEKWLQEHPEYHAYVPGLGIWVDYRRWLGPLGNSIAVVADAAQLMGELSGSQAEQAAAAAYLSLSRNLVGQTGWKDIGDFLEILNGGRNLKSEDASDVLKSLYRYLRQEAVSMVGIPASMGLSQSATARMLVRASDPEEKLVKGLFDQLYAQTPGWSQEVRRRRTITGEPELYGAGVGPEMLKPFTRAFFPGLKAQQTPLNAADQAIVDHDMQISKVSDMLHPVGVMQASSDVETLRGLESSKLTPNEHERLEVLSAMNEAQAKILYGTQERVIPPATMQLVTHSAAAMAQAAADPGGGSPILPPPQLEMSLGEMWEWLTTTPAFQRGAGGRGGGKEKAFQVAAQEYQKWGKELFLELEPDIGNRHAQARIQQQIQRFAPGEREAMRLTYEQAHVVGRPAMRATMGLPAIRVGGP